MYNALVLAEAAVISRKRATLPLPIGSLIIFTASALAGCSKPAPVMVIDRTCEILLAPQNFAAQRVSLLGGVATRPEGYFVEQHCRPDARHNVALRLIWEKGAKPRPEEWDQYFLDTEAMKVGRPPKPDPNPNHYGTVEGTIVRLPTGWAVRANGYTEWHHPPID